MSPLDAAVDIMTDAYSMVERHGAAVARVQVRSEIASVLGLSSSELLWGAEVEVVDTPGLNAVLWAEPNGLDPFTDPYPDGLRIERSR